nr:MAG: hypothetical protein [Lake Baikal virophage 5]
MDQTKFNQLLLVSKPKEVDRRALELYGKPTYLSTRKNKKYMIENDDGKLIHFGDIRFQDATFHKDAFRIRRFKQRNRKWANAYEYSPAYLSYHLLW